LRKDCRDVAGVRGVSVDRSGFDERTGTPRARFSNTPHHNLFVRGEYGVSQVPWGTLRLAVDYYWQSRTWLQDGDNQPASTAPFGLLGARLSLDGVELGGGALDLGVWGRNLLDRKYREFGIDFDTNSFGNFPWVVYSFGERRMVGVDLRWTY
jgi:iron complex outermembrane receptor protein